MRISDWSSDVCSSDLWWSPFLSRVLEPFAVVFNATPKIVVAPILIVWFGIGLLSKVMIAVLICAIVAWLGAFDGVRSADGDQMDMVRAGIGRASCRERVCRYVENPVVAVSLKKKTCTR